MALASSTVAAIAMVAAAGVSSYAAYEQGQTAKATGKFNARMAENEALRVDQEGRESIKRRRRENKRLMGRARARLAKSGVVEEGTPLEVMAETAGQLELAALDEQRAASAESSRLRSQAGMSLWEGKQAARAGTTQAGATLLSGTAKTSGYVAEQ